LKSKAIVGERMPVNVFTSITSNYIPKARVLANSVKRHLPSSRFTVVISDELPSSFALANEPFDAILLLEDLGIPDLWSWVFQHSLVELSTAVKGFALNRLLDQPDCSSVLYFDPDIVVLADLDRLLENFENASILLTPHLTEPELTMEGILDNEVCALQHGIYNLGFIGVKRSAEGIRFAQWWRDRLTHFCHDDIPRGLFTDQRWIDFVPAYFNEIAILRDPIYNVCTWNLNHRKVEGNLETGLTANGQPIVFYHFSGLDSGSQQTMLRKYGSEMPALFELRRWYLAECDRLGQGTYGARAWAYECFDNREPITPVHRKLYRDRADLQSAFPNPYSTSDASRSYFHWYRANGTGRSGAAQSAGMTWWHKVYALFST
jgi:hypothetical protein